MIYTELTEKAMRLAYAAHHGQDDKSGVPYIFHPMHVAEQMEDENTTIAALLHDVVEDTEITFEDLQQQGFPEIVIDALRLLTRDKSVPYMDYVENLKANDIAKAVKLADLRHNMDQNRLKDPTEKDHKRWEKYRKAEALLKQKQ